MSEEGDGTEHDSMVLKTGFRCASASHSGLSWEQGVGVLPGLREGDSLHKALFA